MSKNLLSNKKVTLDLEHISKYGIASLAVVLGFKLIKSLAVNIYSSLRHNKLVSAGMNARNKRNEKIVEFFNKYQNEISKEDIILITSLSCEELVNHIKNKKLTARKAFLCYALNMATIGKNLCYIADCNFEVALQEADLADEMIKNTTDINTLPPLIGLPMTIKDHIPVKGYLDTMGYCSKINNFAKEDCEIVSKLKKLGVVVLGKTNLPQGALSNESSNNLWGDCKNIWDIERTTGGSSGGEAGLISSFCSPIGLGSDIGGSIRTPASSTGIYGFKPTANRNSVLGVLTPSLNSISGWKVWEPCVGFLSRKFIDIVYLSKHMYGSFETNNEVDKRKFDDDQYNSKKVIKIAYGYNYSGMEVQTDIKNSIDYAIKTLKEKVEAKTMNYEFVEIDYNRFEKLFFLGITLILNSGAVAEIIQTLDGEKTKDYYKDYISMINISCFKEALIKTLLKILGEKRAYTFINNTKFSLSLTEFLSISKQYYEEKQLIYDYFNSLNVECCILPLLPHAACKIGNCEISNSSFYYAISINMLNMPSISIPCGFISDTSYKTIYSDNLAKLMKDDISKSKGCPISFQIASLPGQDETALRVARDVVSIFEMNHNDLSKENTQTENFWKYRKI